jgi:hypothetical protein
MSETGYIFFDNPPLKTVFKPKLEFIVKDVSYTISYILNMSDEQFTQVYEDFNKEFNPNPMSLPAYNLMERLKLERRVTALEKLVSELHEKINLVSRP